MDQKNITENLNSWNKLDRYSRWIYNMYAKYIGKKVLDIGGGVGTAISFYIDKVDSLLATELFEDDVDIMNNRFKKYNNFKAIKADFTKTDLAMYGTFDTIILINVLEHIKNDVESLKIIKELLTDNGNIVICVPALKKLYCYMDKNVGHYRRYQKGELQKKAEEVGLCVVDNKYMNFFGIIPYYLKGKICKNKNKDKSFSTSMSNSESKLYSIASMFLEPLEKIIKPPIGISEFIILKKEI